jgi:hypothetical protein
MGTHLAARWRYDDPDRCAAKLWRRDADGQTRVRTRQVAQRRRVQVAGTFIIHVSQQFRLQVESMDQFTKAVSIYPKLDVLTGK